MIFFFPLHEKNLIINDLFPIRNLALQDNLLSLKSGLIWIIFVITIMPNTFTQIHLHCIFAVKYRKALITDPWKEQLHKYITGIVQNQGHKMININTMPDHLHMLFGFRPNQSLSDLMRIVKGDSSEWINDQQLTSNIFRWQEGYGAFSYEKKTIPVVASYIQNQQLHHRKKTFLVEYKEFLDDFQVEYDERYIFKLPE